MITPEQFAKLFPDTAFQRVELQDSPHPFLVARTPNLANCIESATNSPDWTLLSDVCDGRETAVNKGTPKS